jgi:hypothetical protein
LRRLILFKHRLIVSPTKALPPARSHLSGLCVRRVRQLVLHALAALSTRLQRDTYMSSKGATLTLYHLSAQGSQALKTPVPQGVSHLCAYSTKTVGPLRVQILDFKQGNSPI